MRLLPAALALLGCAAADVAHSAPAGAPREVPAGRMAEVYDQLKTPFKWGPVLRGEAGSRVDNPRVFRMRDTWYMTYNHVAGTGGYECWLATSSNLVDWRPVGKLLAKGSGGWDTGSVAGYLGLQKLDLDAAFEPQTAEGRYWMSYLGGTKDAFEAYPLNIGLASTADPTDGKPWTRLPSNPILSVADAQTGWWEDRVQFASHLIRDPARTLGYEYLLFYNAKGRRDNVERIGVAASHDLRHWERPLQNPLVASTPEYRITGDPQLLKLGDLYVMLYFRGAPSGPEVGDHETFACSYDLVNWTRWDGTGLTRPKEPWEGQSAAHKPCVFRWQGTVYHFFNYTHVIDKKPFGGIGLSTSRYIGKCFQLESVEIDRASAPCVVVSGMEFDGYQAVSFRGGNAGDSVRFVVPVAEAGEYDLQLAFLAAPGAGEFSVAVDGHIVAAKVDAEAPTRTRTEVSLGSVRVEKPGPHEVTITLTRAGASSGDAGLMLDSMDWLKR